MDDCHICCIFFMDDLPLSLCHEILKENSATLLAECERLGDVPCEIFSQGGTSWPNFHNAARPPARPPYKS